MKKLPKKKSTSSVDWSKVTVKDFPYSDEQYKKRIVFGKLMYCITKDTNVTVYTRDYFSDRVVNGCAVSNVKMDQLYSKEYKWMVMMKLHYISARDNILYITLIRKHEKLTAEEYFEKMKARKKTE